MNNLQIELFDRNLKELISTSNLTVGIVKLILQNNLSNINELYNIQLKRQAQEQMKQEAQAQKEQD